MTLSEQSWTYTPETLWLPQGVTVPRCYMDDDGKLVKYSVQSESGCIITIGSDLPELFSSIEQRFDVIRAYGNAGVCDLYYTKCSASEVSIPCGWIDNNGSIWVQGTGVGRLKSIINAIMGYKTNRNLIPIHSSVFCVNNRGYGVVGGHGAGKTHALLSIIKRSVNEVSVTTDDWAFLDMSNEMKAKTFDQNASIRSGKKGAEKKVVRLDALGSNVKVVNGITIDEFALIMPWRDGQILEIDADCGARIILSAAYHYPYFDPKLLRHHFEILTEFLRKKMVYCVPTGKRGDLVEAMLS